MPRHVYVVKGYASLRYEGEVYPEGSVVLLPDDVASTFGFPRHEAPESAPAASPEEPVTVSIYTDGPEADGSTEPPSSTGGSEGASKGLSDPDEGLDTPEGSEAVRMDSEPSEEHPQSAEPAHELAGGEGDAEGAEDGSSPDGPADDEPESPPECSEKARHGVYSRRKVPCASCDADHWL